MNLTIATISAKASQIRADIVKRARMAKKKRMFDPDDDDLTKRLTDRGMGAEYPG